MGAFVLRLIFDGVLKGWRTGSDPWADLYAEENKVEINRDPDIYELTVAGREFVDMWSSAEPLQSWAPSSTP